MDTMSKRKPNRIKDYDYSQNGAYFITICTNGRRKILGTIACAGEDIHDIPSVNLSKYGEIVKGFIESIPEVYPVAKVPLYAIMPDHVHLIISIDCENDGETPRAASPTKMLIPKIVNSLKGLSSKKAGFSLWQRSYSDHVIRDYADFCRIEEYIFTNPFQPRCPHQDSP